MTFSLGRSFVSKPWFRVSRNGKVCIYNLSTRLDNDLNISPSINPSVPKTIDEYQNQKTLKPVAQPENPRLLRVAIIGAPNAGKSTLTNKLMGWRVCSVSKKVHTTRFNTNAVLTVDNTQIVFLDTPGLITPEIGMKHKLEPSLVIDPVRSLDNADAIGVIIDAANKWSRNKLDPNLLNLLLKNKDKSSFLVLNKCDCIKSVTSLLSVVRNLTGGIVGNEIIAKTKAISHFEPDEAEILENMFMKTKKVLNNEDTTSPYVKPSNSKLSYSGFSKVFLVSALKGDRINEILDYLNGLAKPNPWLYHPNVVTDQSPQEIAIMALRSHLLNELHQEIPYNLHIDIEMWEMEPPSLLRIAMSVQCHKSHLVRKVIGVKGERVHKLVELTRQELSDTFRCDIFLKIIVLGDETK